MSEAEIVRTVIARLVAEADEPQTRLIHELVRQAGYLWRCGNPACPAYNHRGRRYCEDRPVGMAYDEWCRSACRPPSV